MLRTSLPSRGTSLLTLMALLLAPTLVWGQGINLTGVGPVNRSMGGAGTAAPLDAMGALHWNPGSISALPTNEMGFGIEMLLADIDLSTNIGGTLSKQSGEAGIAPIPAIGWVHHVEGTPVTVGLGLYGIAGFKNNQPDGPATRSLGLTGPAYADAEILQLAPTIAYQINDRLSVGVSPTITAQKVTLMPLGPSVITPMTQPGQGNRVHWGGGVQAGVYYIPTDSIHLGLSVKSPQWIEDMRFFVPGNVAKFNLDFPMIVSLGAAYTGFCDWTFAADVRYFDWDNTDGYSDFGWKNTFAAAVGAQYRYNDCLYFRAGYNFNQNPIAGNQAFTNVLDPLIQEQNITGGVSYRFAHNVDFNLAYVFLVTNSLTGPLPAPPFPAGSTLSHEIDAHSLVMGITVRY